jgi:hypothetical protein
MKVVDTRLWRADSRQFHVEELGQSVMCSQQRYHHGRRYADPGRHRSTGMRVEDRRWFGQFHGLRQPEAANP